MAAPQVQTLLRFLSQDAKLPLSVAITKAKDLQAAGLSNAEEISKSETKTLCDIIKDSKATRKILNAAKRASKKRQAPEDLVVPSPTKVRKADLGKDATPFQIESRLSLPVSSASEEELSSFILVTNRAPLVLAFAVCVTKYTMPGQPMSSRLSLSQAVVSANSRSKAVSLGIETGRSAEEERCGQGQPVVHILGRDIRVLKRWDYSPNEGRPEETYTDLKSYNAPNSSRGSSPLVPSQNSEDLLPPLWGLDLESLQKPESRASTVATFGSRGLPIHTPESARAYLLKSFTLHKEQDTRIVGTPNTKSGALATTERERCLGFLLSAIDIVCKSWSSTLDPKELDRRAWTWYLRVRPDVRSGVGGWGEKGLVKLSDILDLRKED